MYVYLIRKIITALFSPLYFILEVFNMNGLSQFQKNNKGLGHSPDNDTSPTVNIGKGQDIYSTSLFVVIEENECTLK
jgi:hypothetical protein